MPASLESAWTRGPEQPRLCAGLVHVWHADLTVVADAVCASLCDQERARAERILSARHRERWMRSRGVLRALLGRYTGRDPATLRFLAGAHGKPGLLDDAPAGASRRPASESVRGVRVQFNLSHSGDVALYAFCDGASVGVDVEVARRPIDEVAIAERTFGPAEAARLRGLDADGRRGEFLRAWVRHEAQLKCLGLGIGATGAERQSRAVQARGGPWIAQLEVGPRAAAAVAVESAPRELCCWEWQNPDGSS